MLAMSSIIRPRYDEPFVISGDLDHPCHRLLPSTPGLFLINEQSVKVGISFMTAHISQKCLTTKSPTITYRYCHGRCTEDTGLIMAQKIGAQKIQDLSWHVY